jgi:hypothetical protein
MWIVHRSFDRGLLDRQTLRGRMSTQYPVVTTGESSIELDERSCKYDLDVFIAPDVGDREDGSVFVTFLHKQTPEQIVEVAVSLIGPLYYQYPDGKFVELLNQRLKERGFV